MPDAVQPIPVYGNGCYFSPRFEHAQAYPPIADVPIVHATIACASERLLDSEGVLADQPNAIREFARSYLPELRSLLSRAGNPRYTQRSGSDVLSMATGYDLVEAIHIRVHRERMEVAGGETFFGRRPAVAPTRDVDLALQRGGIQVVRFSCELDEQSAVIFYVVNRKALGRPVGIDPFALTFNGYSSPEACARAQRLNRDWLTLDSAARQAVRTVVGLCRRRGDHHINDAPVVLPFGAREALAKPARQGGIGWSVRINPMKAGPFEEPIHGVQLLPCDEPAAVYDWDDLREIAAHWRRIDVEASVHDPARAKELLAAAERQSNALRDWLIATYALRSESEHAQAWWQQNDANERLKGVLAAVRTKTVNNPEWLKSFDAAGWAMPRQGPAHDLGSYVGGIKQAQLAYQGQSC